MDIHEGIHVKVNDNQQMQEHVHHDYLFLKKYIFIQEKIKIYIYLLNS